MAKVLNELPAGLAVEAPSGPPKAQPAPKAGSRSDQAPKALRRPQRGPGGFMNSQEGHEWMMRRCEQFGFASSRYFKGKHTAGTGKLEA